MEGTVSAFTASRAVLPRLGKATAEANVQMGSCIWETIGHSISNPRTTSLRGYPLISMTTREFYRSFMRERYLSKVVGWSGPLRAYRPLRRQRWRKRTIDGH